MNLYEIYQPIRNNLEKVEKILEEKIPVNNSFLKEINSYLFSPVSRGKRLRPALVLFSSKLNHGNNNKEIISLAVALELIHTASLIHDDIIDGAITRRNQLTVNEKWGNQVAVLSGDILYAQAFHHLSEIGDPEIIKIITQTISLMSLGEMEELRNKNNFCLTEQEYLRIVRNKTAILLSTCCRTGALLAGAVKKTATLFSEYGLNFGLAFQIIDDCLDFVGEKEKIGKPIGLDLKDGKITLPLIRLFNLLPAERTKELRQLSFGRIKNLILEYRALDYAWEKARKYIAIAKEKLDILAPSPYRNSFFKLAEYLITRDH